MAMINEAWFHRLKAAQRDLIKTCGGIERCVEITSLSKSQVGRWNNATDPDLMPTNAIYMLENECGMPLVTTALAALNGYRLIAPDEEGKSMGSVLAKFSDLVAASGDVMATGSRAFADGKLTPAEAADIDRACSAMEIKMLELRQQLSRAKVSTLHVVGGDY
ncbi:phage regulatory CII family protein [Bartonella sp. HY761]|uniref:phage regulatory CII family protein n=1 Tax=Bartonella sp. HY761 TaxID=2979330 RepID=UPI00220C6580|nr:phage regulatory CII family protein [Bartonella sp. HY761]UXN05236.1 hypothetical protein N6A79_07860 [Bartonella sp. HY761]